MTVAGASRFLAMPPGAWAFAFRTWAAMMASLYAAFWLQLSSGSIAAVTIAILAAPRRGPSLERALLRLGGTAIGVAVAIAFAGLFNGTDTLLLGALAVWLALCGFAAGLLDENDAYVAVLSGFTVAIIVLPTIDDPLQTFASAADRGASIVLGVTVLAVTDILFSAPDSLPQLRVELAALHLQVRRIVLASLAGEMLPAPLLAELCSKIAALRVGTSALRFEPSGGRVRTAAARRVLALLAAELWESRTPAGELFAAQSESANASLHSPNGAHVATREDVPPPVVAPHQASSGTAELDLAGFDATIEEAMHSLAFGRGPKSGPTLATIRLVRVAARNGCRILLTFAVASTFFILSGLPQTTDGLLHVAIYICISIISADPASYALATVLATAVVIGAVGVTEFILLDGVDSFPLLAIALFPTVVAAALMRACGSAIASAMGTRILVFSIYILSPELRQNYDAQHYLSVSIEVMVGALIFATSFHVILPTSPALRQQWLLSAARADVEAEASGRNESLIEAAFWCADFLAQISSHIGPDEGRASVVLEEACRIADMKMRKHRAVQLHL